MSALDSGAGPAGGEPVALAGAPAELLARLLRFDTTNPPGAEAELIGFVADLLTRAGLEVRLLARDPGRPNLVARLPGGGEAPPLLLHGHVDVVGVAGQTWTHDPFAGTTVGGEVWGRGALDMKGGVAMMVAAVLRAALERRPRRGDVLLALMSDEERRSEDGAAFLVERHPELFAGVRHAIGEFGGATHHVAGRRFYPVQLAEKRRCTVRVTTRGPGGHGAMGARDAAVVRLARVITRLERHPLPVRVDPVVRTMLTAMADRVGAPAGLALRALLVPRLADPVLRALGTEGDVLRPLLRDTVTPTVTRAGEAANVIPAEATVVLDGRLLPGTTTEAFLAALRRAGGTGATYEVVEEDRPQPDVDWSLWPLLRDLLGEADPGGTPVPMLLAGVTDGRFLARLGIQHHGFLPLRLPPGFRPGALIHAADERVPVAALAFGTDVLGRLLDRYPAATG